jgi:hypothetical protein
MSGRLVLACMQKDLHKLFQRIKAGRSQGRVHKGMICVREGEFLSMNLLDTNKLLYNNVYVATQQGL